MTEGRYLAGMDTLVSVLVIVALSIAGLVFWLAWRVHRATSTVERETVGSRRHVLSAWGSNSLAPVEASAGTKRTCDGVKLVVHSGRSGLWLLVNVGHGIARQVRLSRVRGTVTIMDEGPQDLQVGDSMELFAIPDPSGVPTVLAEYVVSSDEGVKTRRLEIPLRA